MYAIYIKEDHIIKPVKLNRLTGFIRRDLGKSRLI